MPPSLADISRRRMELLAEHRAAEQALAAHDETQYAGVRAAFRSAGPGSATVTPAKAREIKLRLHTTQAQAARQVSATVNAALTDVRTESLRMAQRMLATFERGGTALNDQAVFARLLRQRAAVGQDAVRSYLASWSGESGARLVRVIDHSVQEGHTLHELSARVEQAIDSERFRIARIARTETAYAYNVVQDDAITELAQHYDDMKKRWVERVSDSTWTPLDSRVANDSLALHGQVTGVSGVFTMPNANDVDSNMWGQSWTFPPNRSNDRAVVMPWRKSWGIPGWEFAGGNRRKWLVPR